MNFKLRVFILSALFSLSFQAYATDYKVEMTSSEPISQYLVKGSPWQEVVDGPPYPYAKWTLQAKFEWSGDTLMAQFENIKDPQFFGPNELYWCVLPMSNNGSRCANNFTDHVKVTKISDFLYQVNFSASNSPFYDPFSTSSFQAVLDLTDLTHIHFTSGIVYADDSTKELNFKFDRLLPSTSVMPNF